MKKVKFDSVKELANALLDGRKFSTENGTYRKIRFDEHGFDLFIADIHDDETSEFIEITGVSSNGMMFDILESGDLIEHIPWYYNIPVQGVLCKSPSNPLVVVLVESFEEESDGTIILNSDSGVKYCGSKIVPMTLEDVKSFIYNGEV